MSLRYNKLNLWIWIRNFEPETIGVIQKTVKLLRFFVKLDTPVNVTRIQKPGG